MSSLAPIIPKLSAIIPRLSTEHDGEVVASIRAIDRMLRSAGCDWHDLAAAIERGGVRPVPAKPAREPAPQRTAPLRWADVPAWDRGSTLALLRRLPVLSEWEISFLDSLLSRSPWNLSEKQIGIVDRLMARAADYFGWRAA